MIFVTSSAGKLEEARRLAGWDLEAVHLDLPEIQSGNSVKVARAKAAAAALAVAGPLVVDDTGLELAALGGFPGPLVKWMLEAVGAAGITRVASALGEFRATARCVLVWRDGDEEVVVDEAVAGHLVAPRGDGGFGWDGVFAPVGGGGATYAELDPATKDAIGHRGAAWRSLRLRLAQRNQAV